MLVVGYLRQGLEAGWSLPRPHHRLGLQPAGPPSEPVTCCYPGAATPPPEHMAAELEDMGGEEDEAIPSSPGR